MCSDGTNVSLVKNREGCIMNEYGLGIVWIVVKVESGIPVFAEVSNDETVARRREDQLRKEMNPDNDEVGVFSSRVT